MKDAFVRTRDVPLSNSTISPPVYLLGAGWNAKTMAFIAAHATEAEYRGKKVVNGYPTKVYEWKVAKNDVGEAFESFTDLTESGGILRVCVAPDLGYAVPLLECVGADGRVGRSCSASDYAVCNNIWYPRSATIQINSSGGPGRWVKWHNIHASRLNEHISDEEFAIELPNGTKVLDLREVDKPVRFEVGSGSALPAGVDDVILPEGGKRVWYRTVWGAVVIGLGVGLLVLAGLFAARIYRRRGKPA